MDAYAKKTGGQVLAIPHNGNLSNGIMYTAETFDGKPMDRAYAEARASHEPLLEATQIKGDSETHPYLSPNDEFANFERWWNIDLTKMEPAKDSVLKGNYVRSALKLGLELDAKLGANPYKAGMIGGSDAHVGVVTQREDNFFGEFANGLPSPDRWKTPLIMVNNDAEQRAVDVGLGRTSRGPRRRMGDARTPARGSGTRSSARKSTPPRATGRSYACSRAGTSRRRTAIAPSPTSRRTAMPMACPWAVTSAMRRPASNPSSWSTHCAIPDGPNLDRIQIIKGWLGEDGKTQERIFDVAVSGGRKIGPDGRCMTPVGSTVDVANATYTNTIGAAYLSAYWKDPTFNPTQHAFYYVRVIQIPSPRWTAYDQKRFDIKMAENVPMTVTDRAYTSPIWYSPAK